MTDQTPSLDEFRRVYEADNNAWWRLECGHHMNLFDAALEKLDAMLELARDRKDDLVIAQARIAELEAQFDRVRKVHEPIEALNVRYPGGRLTQVCSGCGTDAGNWQMYPCPTIRALDRPSTAAELREVQP
ncbi:hypothetical protein [Nocardia abscessus]|uniref:hypothetical protein n=1 Tax=Nocardia abscessus TaxID=120957 RepID=UPI000304A55C|nr:hypothetical protein [Nocardia abscessus]MCC3333563.1 hypothetical protein [Nocardia abscessus]